MKKIIILLLTMFLLFATGCGIKEETKTDTKKEVEQVLNETVSKNDTESKIEITDYSAANNYGYDSWRIGGDPYYANPLDAAGNTRKCAKCNERDIYQALPYVYDYCWICKCDEMGCNKETTVGWTNGYCDTHAAQRLCIKCFERERENGETYCRQCKDD